MTSHRRLLLGAAALLASLCAAEGSYLRASWTRKLLQSTGSSPIVPVLLDESPCASFNADDAAPLLGANNDTLGWATLKQGSVDFDGSASIQVDLTAHVALMYLADSSSTQADASNVRACIGTDAPNACPVASQLMYHVGERAECTRRRATVLVPVPPNIFNCSRDTPEPYSATFFLQLEVDLANDTCKPPLGTFYAGSRSNTISAGCSYIVVTAACTPSTCAAPLAAAVAPAGPEHTTSIMPIVVGVCVGTGVLVLAILGSVYCIRKRQREATMRRKLARRLSALVPPGEPLPPGLEGLVQAAGSGSSEEDDDLSSDDSELDFSGATTAANRRASLMLLGAAGGRGSTLFAHTPRSALGRAISGGLAEQTPSYLAMTSPGSRLGERLKQRGVVRYAEKYAAPGEGAIPATHSSYSTATPAGQSLSGSAVPAAHSGYSATSFSMAASYAIGFTGRGSAAEAAALGAGVPSAAAAVEVAPEGRYALTRMSAKMADAAPLERQTPRSPAFAPGGAHWGGAGNTWGGVGGYGGSAWDAASPSAKTPTLPRPAPAVTPTPGRSLQRLVTELGFDSPPPAALHGAPASFTGLSPTAYAPYAPAPPRAPEAMMVPDNASAFINPLAMIAEGDSASSDSDAAGAGGGGAGGGGGEARPGVGRALTSMKSWSASRLAVANQREGVVERQPPWRPPPLMVAPDAEGDGDALRASSRRRLVSNVSGASRGSSGRAPSALLTQGSGPFASLGAAGMAFDSGLLHSASLDSEAVDALGEATLAGEAGPAAGPPSATRRSAGGMRGSAGSAALRGASSSSLLRGRGSGAGAGESDEASLRIQGHSGQGLSEIVEAEGEAEVDGGAVPHEPRSRPGAQRGQSSPWSGAAGEQLGDDEEEAGYGGVGFELKPSPNADGHDTPSARRPQGLVPVYTPGMPGYNEGDSDTDF